MSVFRRRCMTTSEANVLALPPGRVVQDVEGHTLRVHDGVTPGGYVIQGTEVELPSGPGPSDLIAGDTTQGFYGEVGSDAFITYEQVSSECGFSTGSLINNDTSTWLKFTLNDTVLFVAKKPVRNDVSWNDINSVDVVYGDVQLTIADRIYRVRLLTGGNRDPATASGGEWNALLYPVHQDDPNNQGWGIDYTDEDLQIVDYYPGRNQWCQEASGIITGERLLRGYQDITNPSFAPPGGNNNNRGWRPVLELVG